MTSPLDIRSIRFTARASRRSRAMADPVFTISALVCAALVAIAVIGPFFAPYAPDETDVLSASMGPSADHLLGTDSLGRDIFSRILHGSRLSFAGPGLIVALSVTAGTFLAIYAAWVGGRVDRMLSRVLNVVFAVPGVLVAILAAAVFGAGFWAPTLALAVVYTPYVARVVRSAALRERQQAYIEACQLAGMSGLRICTRHILPNVAPIILAQATIGFGTALMDFGATSFLGVGVQPPTAEWGLMISDGRAELLDGAVQQSLSAGVMIVVAVVAFNVLGERISSRLRAER